MAGIGDLILGSLVSRGADRLLNPEQQNNKIINSLIPGGGYTGEGTGTKSKGTKSKTFGGIAKQGIMSLIARSILGPILGPLALTLGTSIFNKNPNIIKGLGFFNQDGVPKGPPGIPKGPVIDPDTPIDEGFQVTGDYAGNDFYSAEGTTVDSVTGDLTNADGTYGGNINDEFGPSPTTTTTSAPDPRDRGGSDSDGNGGGGGGGGGSPGSAGPGGSDEMGSFRYGGRASYSGGGLASLYR
jgi:hypothetical protein